MNAHRRRIQSGAVRVVAFLFWLGAWALVALAVKDVFFQVNWMIPGEWRYIASDRRVEGIVTYVALLLEGVLRDLTWAICALAFSRGILWAYATLGHLRTLAEPEQTSE